MQIILKKLKKSCKFCQSLLLYICIEILTKTLKLWDQNVQVRRRLGRVISTTFVSETIMCKMFGISFKKYVKLDRAKIYWYLLLRNFYQLLPILLYFLTGDLTIGCASIQFREFFKIFPNFLKETIYIPLIRSKIIVNVIWLFTPRYYYSIKMTCSYHTICVKRLGKSS